jgi:hypothetical protein
MSSATFAAHLHAYELDGRQIPSVTQVLTLAGISDVSGIPVHNLDRAASIGKAVHLACDLLDADDLDLDSLDPQIVGYVLGYQRFREEWDFVPELIEHRTVASVLGLQYGMCVDRVGPLRGKMYVLDLKTSSKRRPEWAIQTIAYAQGLGMYDAGRAALHLHKDGTYNLIEYQDRVQDAETWEAALQVAYWKLNHGAKVKEGR